MWFAQFHFVPADTGPLRVLHDRYTSEEGRQMENNYKSQTHTVYLSHELYYLNSLC